MTYLLLLILIPALPTILAIVGALWWLLDKDNY